MNINNPVLLLRRVKILLSMASVTFLIVGIALLTTCVVTLITTSVLSITTILSYDFSDLPRLIYLMLSGTISIYGYVELNDVSSAIDNGRFDNLKESLLIWGVLGLVFGLVLPGVILLIILLRYYDMLIKVTTAI
ncbi:MAG: hypothetical protein QXH99_05810 [Sulfolobales archaeon]|jgi:uncharacterized membrane protein YidH (DUF202 family)|nr:hypothetical protein [Desulfurococcaceae archaeon]